ncbi:MAG TPA: GYD domain-containing protein [Candidatus Limnocylindria bacterium]|nr:GYD domain-containing protein [Candidatus Limnocylindria bacterium]
MAKYLVIGSYTAEGAAGVLKEGGSGRRDAARQILESVGGTLESLYWGFGADDFYATVDLPGHAAVTAASLKISASGSARVRTVPLMTADEIDAAAKMSPTFRPPGA